MTTPLRVAVVGLGYGRSHVAELERLRLAGRPVELVAVVDPMAPLDNPSLADSPLLPLIRAAAYYRGLDDLLAAGDVPDVITLATPIHTHAPLAIAALSSGANVMLEKPPTATLAEFESLCRAVEASGRSAQIGFQARGSGAFAAAREVIARGEIGDVVSVGAVGTWGRTRAYYARAPWAGRRTLEGAVVMDGVATNPLAHAVDIALAVVGAVRADDVRDVVVDAWHAHDIEADDTTAIVASTASGVRFGAGLTLCSPRYTEGDHVPPVVTVRGTHGTLRLMYTTDQLEVAGRDGGWQRGYSRTGSLENLVAHLLDGDALIAPVAQTGAFMRVLEAARTGAAPRAVPAECVTWVDEGPASRPIVAEVDEWCERAAEQARTFSDLGAPWTR